MTEKRSYSMTEAAQEQRRQAAQRSTGPTTEAGKARSSRNAWKHGAYSEMQQAHVQQMLRSMGRVNPMGKPCRTTCPKHPDNPDRQGPACSLVEEGLTEAGGDCLDKQVFVDAFDSIMQAMNDGEMDGMHGMLASQMAMLHELMHQLREEVAQHGLVRIIPAISDKGEVIYDRDDRQVPAKIIQNPAVATIIMLADKTGLELGELLVTPRSRNRAQIGEDAADGVQKFLGALGQFAGGAKLPQGRTFEHEPAEEGEDV